MTFIDWIGSTFGTAVVLAALLACFKELILNSIAASVKLKNDTDLATHQDKLQHQSELAIVNLTNALELKAVERGIKLTRVFEIQAKIIADTYSKLIVLKDAADACEPLISPIGSHVVSKEEKDACLENFRKAANDFTNYYRPNKIYLPELTGTKVEKLFMALNSSTSQLVMANHYAKQNNENMEPYNGLFDKWFKTSTEIPEMLKLLENDFQSILGLRVSEKPK